MIDGGWDALGRAGHPATGRTVPPSGGDLAGAAPSRRAHARPRRLGRPCHPGLQRAGELARRADGTVLVLDAQPHDEATGTLLSADFSSARQEEWAEFDADCDKYEAELAKEQRLGKLTLAEFEEEEHSLERLRRWWRDLKARDAFALPEASDAEQHLKRC